MSLSRYNGTIVVSEKQYLGIEYIQGLQLNKINKIKMVFEFTILLKFQSTNNILQLDQLNSIQIIQSKNI